MASIFDQKSVLITGGTGSFGRMCVATLLRHHSPRRIIVFSRDEFKQFQMQQELDAPNMRYFLGDIRDRSRLERAFMDVDFVIHAAALKQVPALEYNPSEAVKTNITGAENVIYCAMATGVKKVVALSTDKAAQPVNLYGATKLVSDKLFIAGNNIKGFATTGFSVVRYGNVLGSRGSVLPFFRELVAKGETTLPITDIRMTRFFITLRQSVDFVLKSFERMHGGELFIPKIPTMKIADLARAVAPQAELRVVGIRPGEKLHEVLSPREVAHDVLEFGDHFCVKPAFRFFHDPDFTKNRLGETGTSVAESFEYTSETNPWHLTVSEIQELLKKDDGGY